MDPSEAGKSTEALCPRCPSTPLKVNSNSFCFCSKCKQNYYTIECFYCSCFLYFSKEVNFDGKNIKCPYHFCGKFMFKSVCPSCNKTAYVQRAQEVGEKIRCANCTNVFRKIKCPSKNCPKEIPIDNEDDFYLGKEVECFHEKQSFPFQKITCAHCQRRLVFKTMNAMGYIQGQKVICPYGDCKKSFNQAVCPKCTCVTKFLKGDLKLGKIFVCKNSSCSYNYSIMFCPYCLGILKEENKSFKEGNVIKCKFCFKEFQFVICIFCKKINLWRNELGLKFTTNQLVCCQNPLCKKVTMLINCPKCKMGVILCKGKVFAVETQCPGQSCSAYFIIYFCQNCFQNKVKLYSIHEKFMSNCPDCNNEMNSFQCHSCFRVPLLLKVPPKNKFIIQMRCPYLDCEKPIYHYKCPFCNLEHNSKTFKNVGVVCPHFQCNKRFTLYTCMKCKQDSFEENVGNNSMEIDDEVIECKFCHSQTNSTYYETHVCQVESMELVCGEIFEFSQPETDYYDEEIMKSMIQSSLYQNMPKVASKVIDEKPADYNKKCIVCLDKTKVSVFAPCGHRCVCLDCGKKIWKEYGKCPLCKEKIEDFLERVVDD